MSVSSILLGAWLSASGATAPQLQHDFKELLSKLLKHDKKIEMKMRPIEFKGNELKGQHDCFWMGPVYSGAFNIAYPDGGAVYWPTIFKMPETAPDAYLEIKGQFPKARYMSVHTYTKGSAPYDHLSDINIVPDEGSTNPFVTPSAQGAMSYTVRIVHGNIPAQRAPNTIYLGPDADIDRSPILLRHYIPETGDDTTGGAGLPKVALVMPDGLRIEGADLCEVVKSPPEGDPKRVIFSPALDQAQFDDLLKKPAVRQSYLNTKREEWDVFWDPRINLLGLMYPKAKEVAKVAARMGYVPKTSGFFANLDNEYVSLNLNEKFGDVVVLEAKLPRIPTAGWDASDADAYDMRYWSLCSNEGLVTTRFSACVYDSQVKLDEQRSYRIVVSKKANRPENAKTECGVTWLDWGDAGDGAGNKGITALLLRNMLPNPKFTHAVQNIAGPGLEAKTMGEYLPVPQYTDKATFESKGC